MKFKRIPYLKYFVISVGESKGQDSFGLLNFGHFFLNWKCHEGKEFEKYILERKSACYKHNVKTIPELWEQYLRVTAFLHFDLVPHWETQTPTLTHLVSALFFLRGELQTNRIFFLRFQTQVWYSFVSHVYMDAAPIHPCLEDVNLHFLDYMASNFFALHQDSTCWPGGHLARFARTALSSQL